MLAVSISRCSTSDSTVVASNAFFARERIDKGNNLRTIQNLITERAPISTAAQVTDLWDAVNTSFGWRDPGNTGTALRAIRAAFRSHPTHDYGDDLSDLVEDEGTRRRFGNMLLQLPIPGVPTYHYDGPVSSGSFEPASEDTAGNTPPGAAAVFRPPPAAAMQQQPPQAAAAGAPAAVQAGGRRGNRAVLSAAVLDPVQQGAVGVASAAVQLPPPQAVDAAAAAVQPNRPLVPAVALNPAQQGAMATANVAMIQQQPPQPAGAVAAATVPAEAALTNRPMLPTSVLGPARQGAMAPADTVIQPPQLAAAAAAVPTGILSETTNPVQKGTTGRARNRASVSPPENQQGPGGRPDTVDGKGGLKRAAVGNSADAEQEQPGVVSDLSESVASRAVVDDSAIADRKPAAKPTKK